METGDNNISLFPFVKDSSLNDGLLKDCHAVLHLHGNGVSLLLADALKRNILAAGFYQWKSSGVSFLENLKEALHSTGLKLDDCSSLKWFLSCEKSILLPVSLYEKGKEALVLGQSSRLNPGETIEGSIWQQEQIVAIYAYPSEVLEWIRSDFKDAEVRHNAEALYQLQYFYPHQSVFAFLQVQESTADLLISTTSGKLLFYNTFAYTAEEDLVYYILFALEQNKILAPELDLFLSGVYTHKNKLRTLLENYIGNVKEAPVPEKIHFSPAIGESLMCSILPITGGL